MPVEERGQGGLDPAPYGKMRLLRRSACEFLRGRKKTPACQPADGRNNSVVRFFPSTPVMAVVREQRPAYLTYPAHGRLHSDRLAGNFTPFRRRASTRPRCPVIQLRSSYHDVTEIARQIFAIFALFQG